MGKHFFDFEDGDFAFTVSDNMAIDSDGNMMMRISLTVGSVCILDKVSDGFAAEHALIRSASSKMMIFFMAFASLRVYGSEK